MFLLQNKQRLHPALWVLSGILLYAAWPMSPFIIFIFFSLVPLFIVEEKVSNPYLFFAILWINFLLWNTATTWWIWNASPGGAVGAIAANSLLMCAPWLLYRFTKRKLGRNLALAALVAYWLTFEYIHHNWELSWPWLTLGNVFSTHPNWVPWYKYTGTTGGSLWVLLVNVLFYKSIVSDTNPNGEDRNIQYSIFNNQYSIEKTKALKNKLTTIHYTLFAAFISLLFPFVFSFFIWLNNGSFITALPKIKTNIVLVQPNIDPYNEKFSSDPFIQIGKLIRLSESKIDTNTRLVVWPETAVPVEVWEETLLVNNFYQPIYAFVKRHPQILLVTGIDSYKNFGAKSPGGFAARLDKVTGTYSEAYNTALGVDYTLQLQLYHKSKLVPGVESLPVWLGFMSSIFDDLGGTSGTLGRSKTAMVLSSSHNPYTAAPIICYESIYGNYVTDYMRLGANVLTVITNDGWWGNTPGYRQHESLSRLRAVETGCWVARSANTGISCFISPQGEVFQPQPWATEAAIKMDIPPINQKTFYVQHGDWLSQMAWLFALLIFIWALVSDFVKKRK